MKKAQLKAGPREAPLALPQPLYEQIKSYVLEKINDGSLRSRERIPSENELAAVLGASRLTVHRALRELAADGILQRIHGVGTFVAPPKAASMLIRLHNIADDIRERGQKLTNKVSGISKVKATSEIAQRMGIQQGQPVFHSLVVYCADDIPVQFEDRYVSPAFAPAYLDQDFKKQSTTDYLRAIAPPTKAENELLAVLPEPSEARLLKIPLSEPCLLVKRTTWVHDNVTTFSRFLHPGSRYRFVG
jgi:GntR family histidine utilization transcriptional repressor